MFFIPKLIFRMFVFLVVLIAILVGINYGAQILAQDELASHIKSSVNADKVTVHIGNFPILYELGVENRIHTVDVLATGVPVGAIKLTRVSVDADQIGINHHQLFSKHRFEVTSIATAQVEVQLTLSGVIGQTALALAHVSVGPDDELIVSLAGRTVYSVRLSQSPIVPDCPLSLTAISGGYSLSCTVAPVPSSLLALLTTH